MRGPEAEPFEVGKEEVSVPALAYGLKPLLSDSCESSYGIVTESLRMPEERDIEVPLRR